MTTPEHTLVGIHFAIAMGCHRKFGWSTVAMAGVASNVPDWDGLPMLLDMQRFEAIHRVWGHNLLAIACSSFVLGWTQFRYRWIEKASNWIALKLPSTKDTLQAIHLTNKPTGIMVFIGITMIVQLLHLPSDMVVSGGAGLSDWAIQPFWPFSNTGYVYPMIPWGDVGPTIVLMSGMIGAAKWPKNLSLTSAVTLLALCAYLLARAWSRGLLTA